MGLLAFQNCGSAFQSVTLSAGTAAEQGQNQEIDNQREPQNETESDLKNPPSPDIVCARPRIYHKTILPGDESLLPCTPGSAEVFSLKIPDSGRALAQAKLVFRNNHNNDIYYWGSSVTVGSPEISYAVGDDICPSSSTGTKAILGSGRIDSENSYVKVLAYQGSGACTNSQISVFSGGTLTVWVEDPRPECAGKDLGLVSTYQTLGLTQLYTWTTSMTELLKLQVRPAKDRSQIRVLGSVEGSPDQNPNSVCGQEAATLISQVSTSLHGVLDTQTNAIPASQGMGHLVLSPERVSSYSQGPLSLSLWVGSNTAQTPIRTGGCCGDGKLGFVLQ